MRRLFRSRRQLLDASSTWARDSVVLLLAVLSPLHKWFFEWVRSGMIWVLLQGFVVIMKAAFVPRQARTSGGFSWPPFATKTNDSSKHCMASWLRYEGYRKQKGLFGHILWCVLPQCEVGGPMQHCYKSLFGRVICYERLWKCSSSFFGKRSKYGQCHEICWVKNLTLLIWVLWEYTWDSAEQFRFRATLLYLTYDFKALVGMRFCIRKSWSKLGFPLWLVSRTCE